MPLTADAVRLLLQAGPLGLTPEQIAAGGATAVLAAVVVLFLRGDIVTRKQYDRTVELIQQTINEKEASLARLVDAHAAEVDQLATERDLWREIAADSLNVSEALVGRVKRG